MTVRRISPGALNRILEGALKEPMRCFIKFYSNTCPYCIRLKPGFDSLAEENQEAHFFAFNIEDDLTVPQRLSFKGVPTIAYVNAHLPVKVETLDDPDEPHEDLWYHPQDIVDFVKGRLHE